MWARTALYARLGFILSRLIRRGKKKGENEGMKDKGWKVGGKRKERWWQCDLDSDTELPLAPGMVCWNEHISSLRLFRPAISYLELCTNVPNISSLSLISLSPFSFFSFLWLTRGPFDPDLSHRELDPLLILTFISLNQRSDGSTSCPILISKLIFFLVTFFSVRKFKIEFQLNKWMKILYLLLCIYLKKKDFILKLNVDETLGRGITDRWKTLRTSGITTEATSTLFETCPASLSLAPRQKGHSTQLLPSLSLSLCVQNKRMNFRFVNNKFILRFNFQLNITGICYI